MNVTFLNEFFVPVIAGIALIICFLIKTATEKLDRYIPCIAAAIGLVIAIWTYWPEITPSVFLTGLFSGLASTGLHQALKNLINREER